MKWVGVIEADPEYWRTIASIRKSIELENPPGDFENLVEYATRINQLLIDKLNDRQTFQYSNPTEDFQRTHLEREA